MGRWQPGITRGTDTRHRGLCRELVAKFDALAAEHQVYAFDLPGQAAPTSRWIFPTERLNWPNSPGLHAALNIESAHVAGHSLGGAVATRLTLMYPSAVKRLVWWTAPAWTSVTPFLSLCRLPIFGELLTRPSRSGSAYFNKLPCSTQISSPTRSSTWTTR